MSHRMAIIVMLLLVCGCRPNADVKESELIRDFFQLSSREQEKKFKTYSLEEQYDLYIWGNQVRHPPKIHMGVLFAENGPIIVPFLVKKLKNTISELTIRDIIWVFDVLAKKRLYDFSKDPMLMRLLEKRAKSMKGIWKETVLGNISSIRKEYPDPELKKREEEKGVAEGTFKNKAPRPLQQSQ
jgi:hypothetical protein